jgi:hypothetical protein
MNQRCFAVLLSLVVSSQSLANVIVSENFDSYNNTAEMQANWGSTGLGTLVGGGNGGNAASHPGGTVNSWIGSSFALTPTDARPVILTADIFDDASSSNKRMTVGLRNGANPLFEMGMYNSGGGQYWVRFVNTYGSENWQVIIPDQAPVAGWHRFSATFTGSSATVTLDLNADGTIDGTFFSNGTPSANPFVDLRFGGPSNLSSAGGGALFDNITLQQVPEPSSMALCGVCLAGLAGYRRRRS